MDPINCEDGIPTAFLGPSASRGPVQINGVTFSDPEKMAGKQINGFPWGELSFIISEVYGTTPVKLWDHPSEVMGPPQ